MSSSPSKVYISCSGSDLISTFHLDLESGGGLTHVGDHSISGGPGPLCLSPDGRVLHVSRRSSAQISSLSVLPTGLSVMRTVEEANNSVYITTDKTGQYVLSCCNGEGGRIASYRVDDAGAISDGPAVSWLSTSNGAHSINVDPTNRHVYVPHVGWDGWPLAMHGGTDEERAAAKHAYGTDSDCIHTLSFDPSTGAMCPSAVLRSDYPRGPRHLCFHPNLPIFYTTDEGSSTITAHSIAADTGHPTAVQTVTTLPTRGRWENCTVDIAIGIPGPQRQHVEAQLAQLQRVRAAHEMDEYNSTSQLRIHHSGRYLFAPNRGHNSIALFSIDRQGVLTPLQHVPTEPHVRGMDLDCSGRCLLAAGVTSGHVCVYTFEGERLEGGGDKAADLARRLRFAGRYNVSGVPTVNGEDNGDSKPMWIVIAPKSTDAQSRI